MGKLFRTLPIMCLVLLIPFTPFLLFGDVLSEWLRRLNENPPSVPESAAVVIGLLSTDIFLPIPSSLISTFSGWHLGWFGGMLASWAGMSLGAAIGFTLARRWGRPLAQRFSKAEDLEQMSEAIEKFGPFVLVLTRAVPVLAEASVLMVGIHRLSWARFLPAVVLSNLGISLAYAAFGGYAKENQWLALALGVSIGLPMVLAASAQRWMPGRPEPTQNDVSPPDR